MDAWITMIHWGNVNTAFVKKNPALQTHWGSLKELLRIIIKEILLTLTKSSEKGC